MNDRRGSLWRRWDLHVHTPASIAHRYGAGDDLWDRYISALEALPPDFSVIGINDYLFLDGYRRVLEYKGNGRLKNIAAFFPVVELRLAQFGGTEGHLRRINYHVIFSNELSVDTIEQQFLSRLSAHYKLSPNAEHLQWSGAITRDSLTDLGQKIIESVPATRRPEYGPPLVEGFNNLNLAPESITGALDNTFLRGRFLTAIGKAEWSALKWNDQSIASKKTLLNACDMVFTAADNPESYHRGRTALADNGVNDKLLDCSDAHGWAESGDKDSLGRCDLWIKADPTFRGLEHALLEFDERVYVGTEPPKLADVRSRPQRYFSRISVHKVASSKLAEKWFNAELPLNSGLVAIVGNKGSGKSALADIIALGANSHQEDNFSFLNSNKFRNHKNDKSSSFEAELEWESGEVVKFLLNQSADMGDVERVRYIPQSYLERLCNELVSAGVGEFDHELRAVIFSHIPPADRLGKATLDALLNYLAQEKHNHIHSIRGDLSTINREIAALEAASTEENRLDLEKRRASVKKEIAALRQGEPPSVAEPKADPDARVALQELQTDIQSQRDLTTTLEATIQRARDERKLLVSRVAAGERLEQRLRNIETVLRQSAEEFSAEVQDLALDWNQLLRFELNLSSLLDVLSKASARIEELDSVISPDSPDSPAAQLKAARSNITHLQNQLDAPTRRYQEFLTAHLKWQASVAQMETDMDNPDSLASIDAEIARVNEIPSKLTALEKERSALSMKIFREKAKIAGDYRRLYSPVHEFISSHSTLAESIRLSFDVKIDETNLVETILDWINKSRAGTFQGAEEGAARLRDLVSRSDFTSEAGLDAFLVALIHSLRHDIRGNDARTLSVSSQLKNSKTAEGFYDLIFGLEYLEPRYALKMDNREIVELSPGERGLLLLLFYLLVERNDYPLILDQPEENLDNETINEVLVPSIKRAKLRRQIIIVTHNPNLAVVADADQVISASRDKSDGSAVNYEPGALENVSANRHVVRCLEGTLPAFMNRDQKYVR